MDSYDRSFITIMLAGALLLIASVMFSTNSGGNSAALAKALEKRPVTLSEFNEKTADKAVSKGVEVTVGKPDGSTKKVNASGDYTSERLVVKSEIEGVTKTTTVISAFFMPRTVVYIDADRKTQNGWVVSKELQDRYGLSDSSLKWSKLDIPSTAPKSMSTFGSSEIVNSTASGYSKSKVTLIWDNGYKLIADPMNGTPSAELPIAAK